MILFKKAASVTLFVNHQKSKGKIIGFVPTMGALHQGHMSLIGRSMQQTDLTVCSIFINPTQFNNAIDFEKYPQTIADDIKQLEAAGCDVLFLPSVDEIYPNGLHASRYALGELETLYEGEYRPGHFQGVMQVVHRLFDIVQPDKVFLGQKDYQQCFVIKQLVHLIDAPIKIIIENTLREDSGLAMSSRNMRLTSEQKVQAAAIYQSLITIQKNISTTPVYLLEENAKSYLLQNGFLKVDYVSIADANTLQKVMNYNPATPYVVLVAAFIGDVRLIDNIVIPASR